MKKNVKYVLPALILALVSGSVLASTSDYFKIHAKNITPVYTNETIQIDGATEEVQETVQQPVIEVQTPDTTQSVSETIDKLNGSITETVAPKVHFGQSINDYQAQIKLEEIGKALIQKSNLPKPVTFIFSSDETINAYAEISGKITVFRGLLDYCEDEAELAFVVGHELSHIQNNDSLKQTIANNTIAVGGAIGSNYAKSKISSRLSNGLSAFGINAKEVTDIAVGTVQQATSSKYSRMHESRADQCSIDYVVKNGYNPLAGISIMFKIGDNYEDLFEDHPSTEKRLQNMYNYIAKKYPQYITKGFDTEAYQNALKNIEK
ncbi:M48 family metallopeptidase [bacterium]|nr:M48 family metallopeptidase [bacterium]